MRGPMIRIQNDVRRTWRCPACGYERRAHADQTSIRCHCEKEGPFMKLVEAPRKPRPEPEILPPYFEYDEEEVSTSDKNNSSSSEQSQAEANEQSPATAEDTKDQIPETNASNAPVSDASADSSPQSDT